MKLALLETLKLLACTGSGSATTTALFDGDCWVVRSTLRARLVKLVEQGLVTRARGRGSKPDTWTLTTKGRIVANQALQASKAAA